MVSAADVAALREVQTDLEALLTQDLQGFLAALNLARPEDARDALLEFLPAIIRQYGAEGAALAADWYDEIRASLGAAGRFRATTAAAAPDLDRRVEQTVRRAAAHLFNEATVGLLVPALLDPATKYMLEPARLTVARSAVEDPSARGWKRVARPAACDFCQMLTGRGAVYTSSTADFRSHGHCHCVAVPEFL